MGKKITVDPITRIEGHLSITVEIENDKVKDAWSSGTMARGFESLLKGKDPRDAPFVTSRFCGVCYSVHQMTGIRALDDAFGAKVPWGGTLLRNLAMGAEYIYDHVLHFYHLSALDYIDIMAVADYKGKDKALNAVKDKVVSLVNAQDTFPLTPRYKPDEFCVKDPDIVISAVKHYLDALTMQAKARNMGAIFGGRQPHYQSLVVGGCTQHPDVNMVAKFRTMLDEQAKFVNEVYVPDVLAFGTGPLFPLAKMGLGGGHYNYLSYGKETPLLHGRDEADQIVIVKPHNRWIFQLSLLQIGSAGKLMTLPIVLGKPRASVLYSALLLATYAWIVGGVVARAMPAFSLLALLTLPLAVKAISGALRHDDEAKLLPALGANVMVILLTQLLMSFGYILARVF